MERRGIGVDRASKMVGTDRRTVYRYLQRQGIKVAREGATRKVVIRRMPLQKKKLISFGLCRKVSRHQPQQEN